MAAPTVLVVDDEPAIREHLRRWIEGWGYNVLQAGSAADALEIMRAETVSILLVDITMPGHDGFWLVERVRARSPRTPIIMATAATEIDTVTKSRRAGVVDYVLKPFGRELLRQALHRAETLIAPSDADVV